MNESVVLCEGYHDRAFWAGWLLHLGLTDPGPRSKKAKPASIPDLLEEEFTRGQFDFYSSTEHLVRIVPCHGDVRKIKDAAEKFWLNQEMERHRQRARESRFRRLVLSIDSDVQVVESSAERGFTPTELISWLWQFDRSAEPIEGGEVLLFGGATTVSLIRWETQDFAMKGIPSKQTLERLVCAAIVGAYPERGKPVQCWLDSRPNPPKANPKEFAWSHMAGWYAEYGSDAFYRRLWNNPAIIEQLQLRLKACDAWRIAEELAK